MCFSKIRRLDSYAVVFWNLEMIMAIEKKLVISVIKCCYVLLNTWSYH